MKDRILAYIKTRAFAWQILCLSIGWLFPASARLFGIISSPTSFVYFIYTVDGVAGVLFLYMLYRLYVLRVK